MIAACPVSPPAAHPPGILAPQPFLGGQGVWVGNPGGVVDRRPAGWYADPEGMKVPFFHTVAGKLVVSGRRLDGPSPPLRADVPDGYPPTGFQPAGLTFPRPGCWQLALRIGRHVERIVVRVHPLPPADSRAIPRLFCSGSQLRARVLRGGAGLGNYNQPVVLVNRSSSFCELGGYPHLYAIVGTRRIRLHAKHGTYFGSPRPLRGALAPGDAAEIYVATAACPDGRYHPGRYRRLEIGVPGGGQVVVTSRSPFVVCGVWVSRFGRR